jgi:dTDP-4-amino-4,6-dideoxygalactose transaminase
VIEDAAEALGARFTDGPFAGRHVGTIGRMGCFSFNGNKIITSGGGGMIVTDEPALARRARHLTTQARLPGLEYLHDEVGYNYRLTNVAAALGLAQLEQLPDFLERKRAIARGYDEAFRRDAGITLPPRAAWAAPSMWLYSVGVDAPVWGRGRPEVLERVRADGVEARPIWSPLHTMSVYRGAPLLGSGGVAERLAASVLSLPSSVGLSAEDQGRVVTALRSTSRASVEAGS